MSLYKQAGSSIWWISLSHPDHPRIRRSSGTTDRKEAQRIHDELKADLWRVAPVSHSRTWGHAVNAWLDMKERSESELLSLRKFSEHYRDRPLAQVDGSSIERALAFCRTAGTYMRYRTMVVAILNAAVKRKWLREVPDIPVRRTEPKTRDWLTHEQWEKLYAELPQHLKAPALFAVSTGLRQRNVFDLRWEDVDLHRRSVRIEAPNAKGRKGLAIPLNDDAIAALAACEGLHDEFVFAYRGRPMGKPKAGFTDACVRAGLGTYSAQRDAGRGAGESGGGRSDQPRRVRRDARNDPPEHAPVQKTGATTYTGFTWHGLRHTWATWHVQNGTPLDVLQKLGGWSDLRMVMNYAHHSPGYLAGFADNTRKKS